jgi:fused signal recognition particle receptor
LEGAGENPYHGHADGSLSANESERLMTEAEPPKKRPGFLGRLFGFNQTEAPPREEPAAETEAEPSLVEEPAVVESPAQAIEADQAPEPVEVQSATTLKEELREPDEAEGFAPANPVEPMSVEPQEMVEPTGPTEPPETNEPPPPAAEPSPATEKPSWWKRLREGLARTSTSLGQSITDVFVKRKLDDASLEDLEDVLIRADFGLAAASRMRDEVARRRYEKDLDELGLKAILADAIARALEPVARPLVIDSARKPYVVLVIGVNGSGKTTTIGKLAAKLIAEGRTVALAAGDTFRAAAIEQLQIWGARIGADVIARPQGADPAALAFDAVKKAQAQGVDVLLIDTAGRLQNRKELMAELQKMLSVIKKVDAGAPHAVLLVLDATVGQNAISQVETFGRICGVTGLVMTKLDGTARGGILVAIADAFKLPVHYIGVGETVDDLEPFAAADFARAVVGLDQEGERVTA